MVISGSLIGGSGNLSGVINTDEGDIGPVNIGHDMLGGSGVSTGLIESSVGKVASVTLNGSLIGGSGSVSGTIRGSDIGPVKIGHDLVGGSVSGSAASLDKTGYIQSSHRIARVSIGGSIIAGIDDSSGGSLTKNASIRAGNDIGLIVVRGSLIGNATANGLSRVIISAAGRQPLAPDATMDVAIKRLSIRGRVELAQILAGYNTALGTQDGSGSIGAVSVGRDWIASDLVAGANADGDPNPPNAFGDADDGAIHAMGGGNLPFARIASITIQGIVTGTATGLDHFGFVAQQIGSFKSLGFTAALTTGVNFDVIEVSPTTGDITVREV